MPHETGDGARARSGSEQMGGDPDNRELRSGIQSEVELLVARGRASTECQNTRTRNGGGNNVAPSVCRPIWASVAAN